MRRSFRSPLVFAIAPFTLCTLFAVFTLVLATGARAAESETLGDKTIDELIVELQKRGVVPPTAQGETPAVSAQADTERDELLAKLLEWFERIDLYGDFRGRFEGFAFKRDVLGNNTKDRYRWRYRLRFGVKAEINEYVDAAFRLATGPDANSGNQTLGSGPDWDPDGVFVDEAYITVTPFGDRDLPMGQSAHVRFGKMPNPFISKKGDDLYVFDSDITPEGLSLGYGLSPCDGLDLNLDLAYYLVEEISSKNADPHLLALQLEKIWKPMDDLVVGFQDSFYFYRNLDQDFFDRGSFAQTDFAKSYGGNVPGGMSDGTAVTIMDYRAYVEYGGVADWPMMVFGSYTKNLRAENTSGFGAGKEDQAWSAGLQVGDKKKWVEMSAAYFQVGANAVPANFTDSDLFDGRTNGKGWHFKLARQIFKNTDLKSDFFWSDALDDDLFGPGFPDAVENKDRIRFRIDVVVKW